MKNTNNSIYYQFNLMSHDYRALEVAVNLYKNSFKTQNLKLQGPIFLPKKEKNIVLLRSPHVNKASREVFKFKQYKTVLILNANFNDLDSFLKRMCLLDIAGVSVQVKKKI